jgi:hypothetical protein
MPMVRVDDKVHKQLKRMADENFRGVGDQVAYLVAKECPHPVEMRKEFDAVVSLPSKGGTIGKGQPVRIFHCGKCNKLVWNGAEVQLLEQVSGIVK